MEEMFSLSEVAEQVNEWCAKHRVAPVNGQAGEVLNERNLRYYRSLGLVDPPLAGGGSGYGEKHRLQVIAIRLLQAQGLPLGRIRSLLFGRTIQELRQIESQGIKEMKANRPPKFATQGDESWSVVPLDDEFMLISRRGRTVSDAVRDRIREVMNGSARELQNQ